MDNITQSTRLAPAVEQEIRRLDELFGLLSVQVNAKKPWYRDVSSIISLAAFVISILTTIFAGVHGYFQQIDTKKSQLHTALSQINALTLQVAEMNFKYPGQSYAIGQTVYAQNDVLAKEAYSLVNSLGKYASATDINLVALALQNTGQTALARKLLLSAVPQIEDVLQYQVVHRHLAILSAMLGDKAGADAEFKTASELFTAYPGDSKDSNFVFNTQFYNELQWAQSIVSIDCKSAAAHTAQARKLLNDREMSNPGNYASMITELNAFAPSVAVCPPSTAGPP